MGWGNDPFLSSFLTGVSCGKPDCESKGVGIATSKPDTSDGGADVPASTSGGSS
jgi:hypothetical protein